MSAKKPEAKRKFGIFRFIFKLAIYSLFLVYLLFGINAAITLFEMTLNRKQDISTLPAVIDRAVGENRAGDVTKWVRLRPLSETETLIDLASPKSGGLEPGIFFEFAKRRAQQGYIEDALFWAQLGRYRLRYDAIRCGIINAYEVLEQLLSLFALSPRMERLLQEKPALVKETIRKVIDFDGKYPARNNPEPICALINKVNKTSAPVIAQERWEHERNLLRNSTEKFLNSPDEK